MTKRKLNIEDAARIRSQVAFVFSTNPDLGKFGYCKVQTLSDEQLMDFENVATVLKNYVRPHMQTNKPRKTAYNVQSWLKLHLCRVIDINIVILASLHAGLEVHLDQGTPKMFISSTMDNDFMHMANAIPAVPQ